MSRTFPRFNPAEPPSDPVQLPRYLHNTMLEIRSVLEVLRDGHLDVVFEAPAKPTQGDIRYADGTSWDPGSGEGIYLYDSGGSWVKL